MMGWCGISSVQDRSVPNPSVDFVELEAALQQDGQRLLRALRCENHSRLDRIAAYES